MTPTRPALPDISPLATDSTTAHTDDDSGHIKSVAWTGHDRLVLPSADPSIALVTAVDRDQYIVRNAQGEIPAELRGRFVYAAASPADLPCVGDWVGVHYCDAGRRARIHTVLPRKSFLRRQRPGGRVGYQMIAANVDVAFIVQSCHFDFNLRRLERYLVMASEGHIEPIILLTKTDLLASDQVERLVGNIRHAGMGATIMLISNASGIGIDQVRECILPGKMYCLIGSSGVGKTTLINHLVGDAALATADVSASGEGRHTSTRRQLVVMANGGLLIDTPGMRELGVLGAGDGVEENFSDIHAHALKCRFTNCTHTSEPGCAVQRAIMCNELDAAHFQSYQKLKMESAFHDMSQRDKRKKDRAFGKLVRSAKHNKARLD